MRVLNISPLLNSDDLQKRVDKIVGDNRVIIESHDRKSIYKSPDKFNNYEIIIANRFLNEFRTFFSRLKLFQLPFAGVNSIDFRNIRDIDFHIANCHSNNIDVAEYAVTLLLSTLKNINENDKHLRKGNWISYFENDTRIKRLSKKNVLIIGYGHIGKNIARMLKPFNCNISIIKNRDSKLPKYINKSYKKEELEKAIFENSIVIVAVPLTKNTKNMINYELLQKMHKMILINISRGEVVNEKGLYDSLKNNILLSAGIDVWYNYPKHMENTHHPSKYPFNELSNIIMTSHAAGYSDEIVNDTIDFIASNIIRVYRNLKPFNVISLNREY